MYTIFLLLLLTGHKVKRIFISLVRPSQIMVLPVPSKTEPQPGQESKLAVTFTAEHTYNCPHLPPCYWRGGYEREIESPNETCHYRWLLAGTSHHKFSAHGARHLGQS